LGAPHVTLNLLGDFQQGVRGEFCLNPDGSIEEGVRAFESPRFSSQKGGLCPDRTNPPFYFCDGGHKVVFFVAKICAE
jgi:hypothetical protein